MEKPKMTVKAARAAELLSQAVRLHQAGRLGEAESLYRRILADDPRNAFALHFLGVLAHQTGYAGDAEELIRAAVRRNGRVAAFHCSLGNVLLAQGRPSEAAAAFGRALGLEPNLAEAHYNLGNALHDLGRNDDAERSFRRAIGVRPDMAAAHAGLGSLLREKGRLDEALAAYRQALRRQPDIPEALNNFGDILSARGCLDDAISVCRRALALRPDYWAAFGNLGNALWKQGDIGGAITAYARAVAILPGRAEVHDNLGNALAAQGRHLEAVVCFEKALSLKPDFAQAHANLGNVLKEQGRLDEALAAYDAALALQPDLARIESDRLLLLTYMPSRSADVFASARRFARLVEPTQRPSDWGNSRDPERRLRIGYVSGDFRRHPVGYFLSAVLAGHDRTKTEIFCYANSAQADDMTIALQRATEHWRTVVGLADEDAARQIIADKIDILVDLSGHTAQNRLALFALKPAPVQVSWLGYWGTTGLDAMDYLLSDALTVPPEEEGFYSERVIRLPAGRFCYAPPDYAPQPAAEPPMRRAKRVTFASFNNLAKIGPDVARLWAAVLKEVPDSRLLLKWSSLADVSVQARFRDLFSSFGIAADRLIFRGKSPHAEMLAEYDDVDVALDPFPFSGGLTSCETLWMGVPVVTLPGDVAPSRQTLGFLRSLRLEAWAASSERDYVTIAAALAADGDRLGDLRRSLRSRMASSPLCDGPAFTRDLETALRAMWVAWCVRKDEDQAIGRSRGGLSTKIHALTLRDTAPTRSEEQ